MKFRTLKRAAMLILPLLLINLIPVLPTSAQLADSKIAFVSDRNGNSEIYVMNADGSNPINLTNHLAGDSQPSWSPDGKKIAFQSARDETQPRPAISIPSSEIYVMNADGANPINLTNHPAHGDFLSWSPDGRNIAFQSERKGDESSEIYVMNANGANPINLTNDLASDSSPSWSPDGAKIAFSSNRGDNDEIYVMDADGSNSVRLTNSSALDFAPSWSPDGAKIAFSSNRDGNFEIYVMNADGANPVKLTNHPARDFRPSWSPDGTRIAFSSDRDGNREIYVINANGSNPINLTNHPASDFSPSWSPTLPLAGVSPMGRLVTTWGEIKAE